MVQTHNIPSEQVNILIDELGIPQKEQERVKNKVFKILTIDEKILGNTMEYDIAVTGGRTKYIPRFESIENMVYRDFVGIHQQRVQVLLGAGAGGYIQYVFPHIRGLYMNEFAGIHDILEGISPFGDIPTPTKLTLSIESQQLVDTIEGKLGRIYFHQRPPMNFEEYSEEFLKDMLSKKSIESKVTSYFDKLDGFMVSFHELVAGNIDFIEPFTNYIKIFQDIQKGSKLPELQVLFSSQKQFLEYLDSSSHQWGEDVVERMKQSQHFFDLETLLNQSQRLEEIIGKYTTSISMKENFEDDLGFPAYKVWKDTSKWVMFQTNPHYWGWEKILTKRGRLPNIPDVFKRVA